MGLKGIVLVSLEEDASILYTDVGPYLQLLAQDAFSPTSTAMRLKLPASTSTLSKEVSRDCLMYPVE